jgi:4-hydroxy-L-threonine phosphate dehydrogenase PdxA
MNKIIFTCGDTNGIGPEIVIKTLNRVFSSGMTKLYFACPENIFKEAAKITIPVFPFEIVKSFKYHSSENIVTIINTGQTKGVV